MKKTAIVISNSRWLGGREYMEPMVNVPILASVLDGKFDYEIIDCNGENLDDEEAVEKIRATNAEAVLIDTLALDSHRQYEKAAKLSKIALPNAITFMGGVYATTCYEHAIENPAVDYILLGHAEGRLDKILDAILSNGDLSTIDGIVYRTGDRIIVNPVTSYIGDVPEMVRPNYEKVNMWPYVNRGYHIATEAVRELPIITSYGCPHNCIFCATRTISGRKVAYRKVADIIDELKYLIRVYDIKSVAFWDDNILSDRRRANDLFNQMIHEKLNLKFRLASTAVWLLDKEIIRLMVSAGCYALTLSIESGCDRVLHDIIRKPLKKEIVPDTIRMCKEEGLFVSANLVVGFPGETWNEIRQTIAFGEMCDPDYLMINIATPLPKTDLYSFAKREGAIGDDFDFFDGSTYQGFESGIITTDEFTPEELEILRSYEWDRINFSTAEKRKKFCRFRGISEEELTAYRRKARLSVGKDNGMRDSSIYGKRLARK